MIIQADAFHLPYRSNYFHSVLFSPPYWGLRKYEGDQGLEPLGLEATPERYIDRMVVILREVRRVLRDDGVVWMNEGDCFAGSGGENANTGLGSGDRSGLYRNNPRKTTITQGNLMLMPHRLAIALQDDGWIVRNDLVWHKPNPMPEPVAGWRWEQKGCDCAKEEREARIAELTEKMGKDRHQLGTQVSWNVGHDPDCPDCHGTGKMGDPILRKSSWRHTRAHEFVFQLVKKMGYYCNQEAVREPHKPDSHNKNPNANPGRQTFEGIKAKEYIAQGGKSHRVMAARGWAAGGRNPRSVMKVPTKPYAGAHYATFPPNLIAPLIRASVPRRCCLGCGAAWAPVIEKGKPTFGATSWGLAGRRHFDMGKGEMVETSLEEGSTLKHDVPRTVIEYRPTCKCGIEEHEPGIVLDIFGGSGTTGMVAKELLRRWVVMDISMPYLSEQARIRTRSGSPPTALEGLPLFEKGNEE